jgi:peptidoglycan/LPS O-acetylase OafA/YrhL
MIEFALGMGLGYLWTATKAFARPPALIGWVLLIGGLSFAILNPAPQSDPRLITRGIAATIAVAGALVLEAEGRVREVSILHKLGNASYSIYLSQLMTLSAIAQVWKATHLGNGPLGWTAFCLFATVATAIVGYGWHLTLERPILALLRRMQGRSQPMPPAAIPLRNPAE